jgi:hypothetical protein
MTLEVFNLVGPSHTLSHTAGGFAKQTHKPFLKQSQVKQSHTVIENSKEVA